MKTLAFGYRFAGWTELQEMSFTSILLCLKQAAEWVEEAEGMAAKRKRRGM